MPALPMQAFQTSGSRPSLNSQTSLVAPALQPWSHRAVLQRPVLTSRPMSLTLVPVLKHQILVHRRKVSACTVVACNARLTFTTNIYAYVKMALDCGCIALPTLA